MRSLLHNESGFTMIELLVVCIIVVIVMGGLATIFGLGLNQTQTSNSILASQSGVVVTLDRLDYEARCASQASNVTSSGGTQMTLTFPSQCTHQGSGVTTVTWCVSSGSLIRYSGSTCTGTGLTLASKIVATSTHYFTCVTSGSLAQVSVALTINTGTTSTTASSGTDSLTLQNSTSGAACS